MKTTARTKYLDSLSDKSLRAEWQGVRKFWFQYNYYKYPYLVTTPRTY